MLGGLHTEMAALRTVGDWLDASGWVSALIDANIASAGKADSFLKAAHVSRTRHAHQMTAASLYILMNRAYQGYLDDDDATLTFLEWHKMRSNESPQFLYWSKTLDLELLVLSFVKSLRVANFDLYVKSMKKLAPWLFALNHGNYACWLPVNVRDMANLTNTQLGILTMFQDGKFVIRKTQRAFSAISNDHAHEQNNKCVKG